MRAGSEDVRRLAEAIDLARRCTPSERAFSVGAVIVAPDGETIATGFSRETGPAAHAEQAALDKAAAAGADLRGATLYSSLEPCSVRMSGRPPENTVGSKNQPPSQPAGTTRFPPHSSFAPSSTPIFT